jgi:TolB-like protein/Tfp pilus assembly protein PilF
MAAIARFGAFEVDLASGELRKHGLKIPLRDKSFQVLAALLERPGEVVTREELRQRLWTEDVFVDFDNNLNTAIARLREALCDSADHPRFIETLPKRGYRLLVAVSAPPPAAAPTRSVRAKLLVLPFLNLSGDPAQEYFSDAMTDEIITELARLAPQQLGVIARTTAMHYKRSRKDVLRISQELGVDYIVEGGVRRAGDRLGVSVQIIQAANQLHLFAERYDAEMGDIFRLQGAIARDVARNIPSLTRATDIGALRHAHLRTKPTEDLAAYNEYIKGRFEMWNLNAEGMAKAKNHFEAALERDPKFALACNALAEMYWYFGLAGYAPSRETDRIARTYVLRAREIDDSSADTHALLSIFPGKDGDPGEVDYYAWEQIDRELARARELNPASRLVRVRYATVLAIHGQLDEAVAELEQVLELDPLALDARMWLVVMLYLGRHYDRALQQALRLVELEPDHYLPYFQLGQVYTLLHRYDESVRAFQKALELFPQSAVIRGFLGMSLGLAGKKREARAVLNQLQAMALQGYVPASSFAWIHLGLGSFDEAFSWLDQAVDAPDRFMEPIKTWPFLDPLRGDPRFHALLRKMRLDT